MCGFWGRGTPRPYKKIAFQQKNHIPIQKNSFPYPIHRYLSILFL